MILVKPALSHADRGYQGGSHSCKQCLITPCIRLGSSNGQTLFSPNYPSNQNGIRHCTSSITCKAQNPQQVDSGSELEITAEESAIAAIPAPPEPDRTRTPGLIFPLGSPEAWDSAALAKPVVRCFLSDRGQRWCLWYSARSNKDVNRDAISPGAGSAGLATSEDGITWRRGGGAVAGRAGYEEVGRVLAPNSEEWWWLDTAHITVSDVQMLSSSVVNDGTGVYWMFYGGGSFEPASVPKGFPGLPVDTDVEGITVRPGLAMSQDGRNWARIEGPHHSGALLDDEGDGEGPSWDSTMTCAPQVVTAGPDDYRMYYHSWDESRHRFVVGFATSRDAMRWRRQGAIFEGGSDDDAFDCGGALNVHVIKDAELKKYLMFYEAVDQHGRRSIGIASSSDGIRGWKRRDSALLEGSSAEGAWDYEVGGPCVVPMAASRYRLYYSGRSRNHSESASNTVTANCDAGEGTDTDRTQDSQHRDDAVAQHIQEAIGKPWQGFGLALTPQEESRSEERFEGLRTDFERLGP